MMNKEEKQRLIHETACKMAEAIRSGKELIMGYSSFEEYMEADNDHELANNAANVILECEPLLQEYNKELMEVINPINAMTLPVLVYALKTTLAVVENDMDEADMALYRMLEDSHRSVHFSIPNKS